MRKAQIYDTIIVGAGPAGMTAAIYAAGTDKDKDNQIGSSQGNNELSRESQKKVSGRILLLDRLDTVGKKLLVTGNGKCNITNLDQKPEYYRSDAPEIAWSIFSDYNEKEVLRLMERLGICIKDRAGYVYPYNEQASSVREAFEAYLNSLPELTIKTGQTVNHITWNREKQLFQIRTVLEREENSFLGYTVIIASGGYAGLKHGCKGDGFNFARSFGHSIIDPQPALTALCSSAPFLKKLNGVRCRAAVSLMIDDEIKHTETGELQWTDYGISGIAVFSLSRFAVRAVKEGKRVAASIDLMPDLLPKKLLSLLRRFRNDCKYKDSAALLNGLLPSKLSPVILREAKIKPDRAAKTLSEGELIKLAQVLKGFFLGIQGYKSYEKAQITMGGVPLSELTKRLESKYRPGLFFAGEVTDVDGACGGYNLQWAFTSGKTAGAGARDKAAQFNNITPDFPASAKLSKE